MEFRDICTKTTYKKNDGTEQTRWLNCGTLKIMDKDKLFIELNMFPGTTFYVFKKKDKEASPNFGG